MIENNGNNSMSEMTGKQQKQRQNDDNNFDSTSDLGQTPWTAGDWLSTKSTKMTNIEFE